jgi:hypothetical protein
VDGKKQISLPTIFFGEGQAEILGNLGRDDQDSTVTSAKHRGSGQQSQEGDRHDDTGNAAPKDETGVLDHLDAAVLATLAAVRAVQHLGTASRPPQLVNA